MQSVFEKIKERLEQRYVLCINNYNNTGDRGQLNLGCAYHEAIEIVEQEALEQELSEWCHDCKEYDKEKHCCPRFCKIIRETVAEIKENYNTDWVPCSERLPIEADEYFVTQYRKEDDLYRVNKIFLDSHGWWDDIDVDSGWEIIAWREKFAPYKPKGE